MDLSFLICKWKFLVILRIKSNDYRVLSKGPSSQSKCSVTATGNNTENKNKTSRMMQGGPEAFIIQIVAIFPLPVFERHIYDQTETICHLIF